MERNAIQLTAGEIQHVDQMRDRARKTPPRGQRAAVTCDGLGQIPDPSLELPSFSGRQPRPQDLIGPGCLICQAGPWTP